MGNYFKTALLMSAMTALFMGLGFMFAGMGGMMIAFGVAIVTNLFAYWNADRAVLKMHGAKAVSPQHGFHQLIEQLAHNAELPMPKVYIMANDQPNAFATGRNPEHAAVAATTGLLDMLSEREISGVMAHELAHIQHRDTLTMTITATLAGAISMLGNIAMFRGNRGNRRTGGGIGTLIAMFVAPLAASLVQMAISRTREYSADRRGAEICQDPQALANALRKIDHFARGIRNEAAERSPASAHLFIINPLSGKRRDALFATHPHTDNRIERLMAMAPLFAEKHRSYKINDSKGRSTGPWG